MTVGALRAAVRRTTRRCNLRTTGAGDRFHMSKNVTSGVPVKGAGREAWWRGPSVGTQNLLKGITGVIVAMAAEVVRTTGGGQVRTDVRTVLNHGG